MDIGIINPKSIFPTRGDGKEKDPITLAPTFYGEEYTDQMAYLKFNNAIERMSQPREVDHNEADVEFITRNDAGSLYAVVYHYQDGSVNSDMLVKAKNGGWSFYRASIRFHPNFVSTYIPSIWGYKKVSESQVAQELAQIPTYHSKMVAIESHALTIFPGGIVVSKCAMRNEELSSVELIDFIRYESFDRDKIKDLYSEVLERSVNFGDCDVSGVPECLIEETLGISIERMKNKNKGNSL